MRRLSAHADHVFGSQKFAFALMAAIALAISAPVAHAQLSTASVTGVVRDSTGSNVVAARLALVNLDTTVKHETVTNSAGNYAFLSITPGNYSLEVSAPGFQVWQLPKLVSTLR